MFSSPDLAQSVVKYGESGQIIHLGMASGINV